MIATVGVGWCFVINAVSYIGVLFALRAMTVAARRRIDRSTATGSVARGCVRRLRTARSWCRW